ncbi:ABC transporter permease [Microvirga sp. ACRRW]|uniref:ABC transporter permease n=1 Tax=Microvirga sp. ACRRW TaxID=2918205 RepID=UPI001EF5ECFE|nr:ABC transporter permease [Microvirga sp. ACRRW]MCG7393391.1 ABC transporter permease [Microvirga sp. ACRRW]
MLSYSLRRLALALPTLLLAGILVFALMRLVPGDPALMFVGDVDDPEAVIRKRAELGLDRSLIEQFLLWSGSILSGDLGTSVKTGSPVATEIAESFPVTAQIVLIATFLSSIIAIPLGMIAAWKQNSSLDVGIVGFTTFCLSIPSFWMAVILLTMFGVNLGWLPTVGYVSMTENLLEGALYLIMPVTALLFTELATLTRMSRASTIDVLRLDYITHARAKGLGERTVLWKHAFPNAFAPTLTVLGLLLGHLLGGVVVLETMFSLPGMGRLMIGAIFARDYPVVQGVLLFIVMLYVVINLAVDLLYPAFDPRVKL